jgi:hypothetical protein
MRLCRGEARGVIGGQERRIGVHSSLEAREPAARRRDIAEGQVREPAIERVAGGIGAAESASVGLYDAQLLHGLGIPGVLVGEDGPTERRRAPGPPKKQQGPQRPVRRRQWPTGDGAPTKRAGPSPSGPGRRRNRTIVHGLASDSGWPSFVPRGRFVPW